MLPIYISYLAGESGNKRKTMLHSIMFVAGFSIVFCLLGVFAGSLGLLLSKYRVFVNIITGLVVILFGLSYLDIVKLPFFNGNTRAMKVNNALSAFVFGMIFSISLSPCVGAFLGSALMLASASGTVLRGVLLLLSYSLGLSIPFLISSLLINELKSVFSKIKRHYKIINMASGIFLIIVGILMMFGILNYLLTIFS